MVVEGPGGYYGVYEAERVPNQGELVEVGYNNEYVVRQVHPASGASMARIKVEMRQDYEPLNLGRVQ